MRRSARAPSVTEPKNRRCKILWQPGQISYAGIDSTLHEKSGYLSAMMRAVAEVMHQALIHRHADLIAVSTDTPERKRRFDSRLRKRCEEPVGAVIGEAALLFEFVEIGVENLIKRLDVAARLAVKPGKPKPIGDHQVIERVVNAFEKRSHIALPRVVAQLFASRVDGFVLPAVIAGHMFAVGGIDHLCLDSYGCVRDEVCGRYFAINSDSRSLGKVLPSPLAG